MSKDKTAMCQLIDEFERIKENDCKHLHEVIFFDGVISIIESKFFEIEKNQMRKIYNQGGTWASEIGSEEFFDQDYTQSSE